MLVARVNAAIHQPTARAVRSRSALGWLLWLLRGRKLSYRSATTAALLSPAARDFLRVPRRTPSVPLTGLRHPPIRLYNVHIIKSAFARTGSLGSVPLALRVPPPPHSPRFDLDPLFPGTKSG